MTGPSLRIGTLSLVTVIVFHISIIITEGLWINPSTHGLMQEIKRTLPSSLTHIEEVSPPKLDNLYNLLKQSISSIISFMDFFDQSSYINEQFRKLNRHKQSSGDDKIRLMNLYSFANQSTSFWISPSFWERLNRFIRTIIPNSRHEGIFHMYSEHIKSREDQWCGEGQSFNYLLYSSLRYSLNIIRKGYSVILQSYIIRNAFEAEGFNAYMDSLKQNYRVTVKNISEIFIQLESGVSTKIIPCHPRNQVRGSTFLEMEKLIQGVLPQEITLDERNAEKKSCQDYRDEGTAHYPYKIVKPDGDTKCHGMIYDCFPALQTIHIFRPRLEDMGKVREEGNDGQRRTLYDQRYRKPRSPYVLEQCNCLCDDFEHPKTLRKFSREYAMADYKNNMVVTGIRLVNISNVIHIQIQEGKLEKYGSINPSTVQWRLKNDIVNRSDDLFPRSSTESVTLSYHKRRVNLGLAYSEANDVVIGAAFDWDLEEKGVELVAFGTVFSFSTGKLSQDYRKRHAPSMPRKEIVLEDTDKPELCYNNVPVGGDNRFIKFQTTDWLKDAAQTTIPYLDIQPVVTNPPVMLRGIGLYYKNAAGCGGYIGLEVHSHEYEHFIFYNETLY